MEEEKCGECGSLEEEIYWSHFQSLHFLQILPPDFYHHLAIPETFSQNLKKKLPKVVTLKGPSGSTWEVGLTIKSSVMFFTHGWSEFAIEHLLCEKDLLVFKYNRESQFDVLVFDGNSLCEKATTYFVRKCGHRKNRNDCQAKRKIREISVDDINTPEKTVIQDMAAEEIASDDTDEILPLRISTMEHGPNRRIRRKLMAHDSLAHEIASDGIDEVSVRVPITEYRAFKSIWQKIKVVDPHIRSQSTRNEASPDEKEAMKDNALRVGRATVTKEGFFVVMRPTNLFPKFNVAVPTEWVKKRFINPKKQNVILCFEDRSWCVTFLYYRKRKRATTYAFRAYLCRGWRAFAVENKLKEFDVCVFEPETPASVPLRLNVNIIRCHLEDQCHLEDHNDCQTTRKIRDTSVDVITTNPKIVVQDTPREKISSGDIDEVFIVEDVALQRIQQKLNFAEPSETEQSTRLEPPPGFLDVDAITTSSSVVVQALPAPEAPNDDDIDEIQLGVPIREDTDHKKIDTVEPSITKQSIRNDALPGYLCEAPPFFKNEAPTGFRDINSITASLQVIAQASPVDKTAYNGTHGKPLRLPITEDKAPKNIWQKIELKGPITKLSKGKEASPAFLDVDPVTSSLKTSTDDTGEIPSRVSITENTAHKRIWQKIDLMEVSVAQQSTRNEAPPGFPEAVDYEPDAQHKPMTSESLMQNVRKSSSKTKRLMTGKEKMKDNAMRAAQAAVTREGFFVIMKPTYLYPKFFMVIPIHWMKKRLINPIKQSVILCLEDRTWNVQFLCYDGHGASNEKLRGVLSAGWKRFALDNKLKEFDACVFEPADTPPDVPYRFNVNIIRCPEQEGSECLH